MPNVAEYIQCDSRNYTAGRQGNRISKIVVHYTGTEASAHNNLLYFSRSSAGTPAHYFIEAAQINLYGASYSVLRSLV